MVRSLTLSQVTMPDESQGFQEKGKPGDEASQVSAVPDIMVVSSDGKSKITRGNNLELDDFGQSAQRGDVNILQSGLGESQAPVEVGVAKIAQAPEPLMANSLLKGTGVTLQATDHDVPVSSPSDKLKTDNSTNGCSDSDYSSAKSSPGYACTSFSTDLCEDEVSQLDGGSLEKSNPIPPVNFSEHTLDNNTKNSPDANKDISKIDLTIEPKAENSIDDSLKVYQTRDSIDFKWDEMDGDEDRRSTQSKRTLKEDMCCCYQTIHRAFLHCVEETPAMVSGLVLSLAFCVVIIILIPTTRVRHGQCVCVSVCVCVCVCM